MKIIVLAGGNDQIYLIKELRKYYGGAAYIILIDYLDAPVAAACADRWVQLSTLDREAVLAYAKKEKIDLIVTACTDQALVTMAYVAEQMNLKCYLSYAQALELTNKKLMKQKMVRAGICTAGYMLAADAQTPPKNLKFPLVVKPVDCNSSKGISRVEDRAGYERAVSHARSFSATGQAIVEEYIDGREYSIDIFVHGGKVTTLLITETKKWQYETEKFIITQSIYQKAVYEALKSRIEEIAEEICREFHILDGPMILQVIKRNDDIFVIEFSARTGGGNKVQLIERITGVNVLRGLLDTMEGKGHEMRPTLSERYVNMDYVYARSGMFREAAGLAEIKKKGIIDDFFFYKSNGSVIDKIEGSTARIMSFMVSGETREELLSRQSEAEASIKIAGDGGQDMMIREIYC